MSLPSWLAEARRTVPAWLAKLGHTGGPGRYRFALDAYEPCDLDSSCLARSILRTIHGEVPSAMIPGWVEYLQGLQRPADGLLIDPGMERHILSRGPQATETEVFNVRRFITRNGLTGLLEMGALPRYRLADRECFATPAEAEAWLAGLNWRNPWGAGSWAGALLWRHRLNELMGDESAGLVVQATVEWLLKRQDPRTGAWSDGGEVKLNVLVNGIFKVWIQAIPAAGFPVRYPERVIDLCIRALREDPALAGTPDACSIFDVAYVLDVALRHCDHRRAEVAELAAARLPSLEPLYREDGAFSYGPEGSLFSHGGLHLAPVRMQSDAAGTAIAMNSLALLCNLCGLRGELGWTPVTEVRMRELKPSTGVSGRM